LLYQLKQTGYHNIKGIDLCEEDINAAKELAKIYSINCTDVFEYFNTVSDKYDIIISRAIMEHIKKE
jgi:2-polyprenyl-3-methyl-5-hydroxy-6-metoxy-1,4-benzoquinol methylase